MDPYIGKMLDNRYEILEPIGKGGMAVVYKAKCHRLNRLVAVKILKSDLAQDADFRRRFNAESQAVALLSHPNIVSVYDVSKGGDIEYIVMELIDGITLKQYMERRGLLNWRESLHFITQIMRALSHAHSRGIVHRDIKPQNIMVLRDGSVRVTDFGIACLENSAQTLTQEALGSVHYISPEQARGDRTDARSDIYSSGVVLYEMLTGRLPFVGDSAVSVAIQHLSSIPLAPREINKEIPEQLELICMKAMTPDLERRYASAEAMISDLETFRKNPDVDLDFDLEDLRPEEVDEPTRPLRTAGIHAAAQQHGRTSVSRERERRRDYEEDEDRRSNKTQTVLWTVAGLLAAVLVFFLFRSIFASFQTPAGPEQYVVKNVLGMTVEEAAQIDGVKDIFTLAEQTPIFSSEYDAGEIARQDPAEGEYRKGDNLTIKVWVSMGEETGEMPNVKDMTVLAAKAAMKSLIEKYELTIDASEEYQEFNDEIEKGHIIRTYPEKGEQLKKGDTIQVVVSKGPEFKEVKVLKFIGINIETARNQLETLGLVCEDADIEIVPSSEGIGTIVWQSLEPNTMAKEGDTIKFQVSSGSSVSQPSYGSGIITSTYELPQDGRKTVHVTVYVSHESEPQFDDIVSCEKKSITIPLQGSGEQEIKVYFDGELETSHTVQFQG
ncbi:MAG: Stk1 family PASTA domain-containing Ser/Thr kinase [Oscillibacter sp.]|nr:Stk1 family PASTA domain-containing Ser/Thr kinase [Oscillibacter sp.]